MTKFALLLFVLVSIFGATGAAANGEPPLFVVHFTTGPDWDPELSPAAQEGFEGHASNLKRLRDEGQIIFGARYGDLGMVFLHSESLDAARQILDRDPGVVAGIFTYEINAMRVFYPWRQAVDDGQ